jgi:hypothetical protein
MIRNRSAVASFEALLITGLPLTVSVTRNHGETPGSGILIVSDPATGAVWKVEITEIVEARRAEHFPRA